MTKYMIEKKTCTENDPCTENHDDIYSQKMRIVRKDNPALSISEWHDYIYPEGLVNGDSDYYLVKDWDSSANRFSMWLFVKNSPVIPVSYGFKDISKEGVLLGNSIYYIATTHHNKQLIYRRDNKYDSVSNVFDKISVEGLVKGESDYYLATEIKRRKRYQAIFHFNNSDTPISKWWYRIHTSGLLNGKSDLYVVTKKIYWVKGLYKIFPFLLHDDGYDMEDLLTKIGYGLFKETIFHADNSKIPITKWYNKIYSYGAIIGLGDKFVAIDNGKEISKNIH